MFGMRRINLLPFEDKKIVLYEKARMASFVFGSMAIAVVLFVSVGIFAIRWYVQGIVSRTGKEIQMERLDPALSRFHAFRGEIEDANAVTSRINSFSEKERLFSDRLRALEKLTPQEIRFIDISIRDSGNVLIVGNAPTRESFLQFKTNIEQYEGIMRLSSPPENILKPEDIQFSVQFVFK
jgi:hypothetical protein